MDMEDQGATQMPDARLEGGEPTCYPLAVGCGTTDYELTRSAFRNAGWRNPLGMSLANVNSWGGLEFNATE